MKQDFDVSYAYKHAVRERAAARLHQYRPASSTTTGKGFPYPVVPFHVNCYGSSVIAKRGSSAHLTGGADPNCVDPPGPNPSRCFDIGAAAARTSPTARGGWRWSPRRAGRTRS
jgi:hypothetical protein